MKFFKFLRVLLIIAMAIDVLAIIPLAAIFIYLPDSEIVEMIMERNPQELQDFLSNKLYFYTEIVVAVICIVLIVIISIACKSVERKRREWDEEQRARNASTIAETRRKMAEMNGFRKQYLPTFQKVGDTVAKRYGFQVHVFIDFLTPEFRRKYGDEAVFLAGFNFYDCYHPSNVTPEALHKEVEELLDASCFVKEEHILNVAIVSGYKK